MGGFRNIRRAFPVEIDIAKSQFLPLPKGGLPVLYPAFSPIQATTPEKAKEDPYARTKEQDYYPARARIGQNRDAVEFKSQQSSIPDQKKLGTGPTYLGLCAEVLQQHCHIA